MNTNIISETIPAAAVSTEPRGLLAALVAAVVLAVRQYLKRKAASRPEPMSRSQFLAEMVEVRERLHTNHLALVEKLETIHRELLAALERQGARISALEAGFARLDERTANQ